MRFFTWHFLFAVWLMFSAFILPQSAASAAVAWVSAIAIGVLGLLAHAKPDVRFVITGIAGLLFIIALFLEDMPMEARVNLVVVAVVMSAFTVVKPRGASFKAPA